MNAPLDRIARAIASPRPSAWRRRSRRSCLCLVALALASPRAAWAAEDDAPFRAATIGLPSAQGEVAGVSFVVRMDAEERATVGVDRTPYWVFGAAGAMAIPLALLGSFAGLGVLAPVVAPPFNAAFNARRDVLVRAVAAERLPAAVADALADQLRASPAGAPVRFELGLSRFGLASKSGKSLALLEAADDLCLGAEARLGVAGPQDHGEHRFGVGPWTCGGPDAPRPVCASMARFAENDGLLLRQAIRELAEILAAMALARLERAP